jgi:hypothetical protein
MNETWVSYDYGGISDGRSVKRDFYTYYSYIGHSAVMLDDDSTMVIFGGICSDTNDNEDAQFCNNIVLIDIYEQTSTLIEQNTTNWPDPRAFHSVVYAGGYMYVTGGLVSDNPEYPFDPYDNETIVTSLGDVSKYTERLYCS